MLGRTRLALTLRDPGLAGDGGSGSPGRPTATVSAEARFPAVDADVRIGRPVFTRASCARVLEAGRAGLPQQSHLDRQADRDATLGATGRPVDQTLRGSGPRRSRALAWRGGVSARADRAPAGKPMPSRRRRVVLSAWVVAVSWSGANTGQAPAGAQRFAPRVRREVRSSGRRCLPDGIWSFVPSAGHAARTKRPELKPR